MSIEEFRKYPHLQQWQIAGVKGKVILSRNTPNHLIKIYQLEDFFIEIWENLNNQMLDSLTAYKSSRLVEKYTDQIKIDDLYH